MKKNCINTPIFIFDDHVDYLQEWYHYAKKFGLTQSEFLEKAGIKAKAFLSDILGRRKKIGRRHTAGFVEALELEGDAREYFTLLVRKELSRRPEDKRAIIRELAAIRKRNLSTVLEKGTLEYFASWKYPVIREFILWKGAATTPAEISDSLVNLRLSTREVEQALDKLAKWGLISVDRETGAVGPADTGTVTYSAMPHPVVNDVKRTLIEASVNAMEDLPRERRHISMAIKGTSEKSYRNLCSKIDALRNEFLAQEEDKDSVDRIISLNVQAFPLMDIERAGAASEENRS
jgi:uncharacterized protein (TIGR02147 family)